MARSVHPEPAGHCPQCGSQVAPDSNFCERCGGPITQPQVAPPPVQTSYAPHPAFGFGTPSAPDEALLGAAVANETYLGNRLMYTDGGTSFDPLLNATYQRALIGRFLATIVTWLLASTVLFLIFVLPVVLGLVDTLGQGFSNPLASDGVDSDSSAGAVALAWNLLQLGISVLLACLFWFRRIPVQLTEWMITVDGRGEAARAALDHMYAIITARHTPIRSPRVVRLNSAQREPRHYLRLDDERFTGFVSAFGFGSDLFIGWTFWLNMSPARWLLLTLARMFGGHGLGIYGSVAYDSPKALREVMHSAVRQGVDMATGQTEPKGQGMIGTNVPIIGVDL